MKHEPLLLQEYNAICNLLARIHRDGGHHTDKVGLLRSTQHAEEKVIAWLALENECLIQLRAAELIVPVDGKLPLDTLPPVADNHS